MSKHKNSSYGNRSFYYSNQPNGSKQRVKQAFWRCNQKVETLDEDIKAFVKWMEPTNEEIAKRHEVQHRVFDLIKTTCGTCKPTLFGSTPSGLFSPLSDIDIVILELEGNVSDWISLLATSLGSRQYVTQMKVLSEARVPLIKFLDATTGIRVDICFGVETGVRNTELVKKLLEKYPKAKPIFVVVKYLLSVLGLNEVYTGGIGSYALLLMVVGFLQQKRDSFSDSSPLANLLSGFFCYYGFEFMYSTNGISVTGDGSLFLKEDHGWLDPKQPHMLCIEDPNDTTNDVTRSSWNIYQICSLFYNCYQALALPRSTLATIFPPYYIPVEFLNRGLTKSIPIEAENERMAVNNNSLKQTNGPQNKTNQTNSRSRASSDNDWRSHQRDPSASPTSGKRKRTEFNQTHNKRKKNTQTTQATNVAL